MSDWIKARATEIKLAEKEKKDQRELAIEASNTLKAKVEPFWQDLVRILKSSVDQFNTEFPEAERAIGAFERPSSAAVVIRRTAYPATSVKAQLNSGSTSVNYTISLTPRKGAEPLETQGSLVLGLKDGNPSYIADGVSQHDDVAKLLLNPFFQFQP